jgi:hypothetical protein
LDYRSSCRPGKMRHRDTPQCGHACG